jgi:hypothetical protein
MLLDFGRQAQEQRSKLGERQAFFSAEAAE